MVNHALCLHEVKVWAHGFIHDFLKFRYYFIRTLFVLKNLIEKNSLVSDFTFSDSSKS